jgi:hypothetical protein
MANPTCAPFNDQPLYVNRSAGENDPAMLDLTQITAANKANLKAEFDNSDAANFSRMRRIFAKMTGMTLAEADAYVDNKLKAIGRSASSPQERMQVMAVTEQFWERRGAGLQTMATSYLAQRKEGQEAISQAMEFMSQLKSFNRLGQKIAKENWGAGSALRQKRILNGNLDSVSFADDFGTGKMDLEINAGTADAIQERLDAFEQIAKDLNGGNLQGALDRIDKIAKQIEMLEDPTMAAGIVSKWKSTWNTWDEVWINGLLSSTATFVVNATSAAWVVMRPLLQLGAAEAFAATGLGGKQGVMAAKAAAAEAGAQIAQMQAVYQDAAILGWRAFKNETSVLQATQQKITKENFRKENILWADKWAGSENMGEIIDRVGQITRLPSRGMLGMDEFSKVMAMRGEVAANGVKKAVMKGVDPTDKNAIQEFIDAEIRLAFDVDAGSLEAKYAFDPSAKNIGGERAQGYLMENMDVAAGGTGRDVQQRARASVFQEENAAAKAVSRFVNKNGLTRTALKPFIPFTTTPTNILKQGIVESTGVGAAWEGLKIAAAEGFNPTKSFYAIQKELLNDPAESARIAGQIAFMTTVGAMIYGMAMDGRITGGGPGRWGRGLSARNEQNTWIAQGNVPYSLDVGGGVKVPLGRLGEPFATGLRMIADLGYYSGFMSRQEQDKEFSKIAGLLTAGLYEASFLTGVNNLMRLATAGPENFDYELGRGVQNYFATQTPFGSLLAQVDRMQNPYKAAYEGATFSEMINFAEVELGQGVFGKMLNKFPGFEGQPPLVDQVTGQKVPITPGVGPNGLNPLMQAIPFLPRQTNADPVWQAVFDIQGSYSQKNLDQKLLPTAGEQQQFNGIMAETRIGGKTLAEAVMEFRNLPEVQEYVRKSGVTLLNSEIQRRFKRIFTSYANRAKNIMLNSNANFAERAALVEAANYAEKAGNVEQYKSINQQIEGLVQRAQKGY